MLENILTKLNMLKFKILLLDSTNSSKSHLVSITGECLFYIAVRSSCMQSFFKNTNSDSDSPIKLCLFVLGLGFFATYNKQHITQTHKIYIKLSIPFYYSLPFFLLPHFFLGEVGKAKARGKKIQLFLLGKASIGGKD